MKEFKKWQKKERQHALSISADCSKISAKKTWRAALEWAYKQETDPQATEIGDAILRELGE